MVRAALSDEVRYQLHRRRLRQDEARIGTSRYRGLGWFWAYAYRYPLRDATHYRRRLVHAAFLKAGLPVAGESAAHAAIIARYFPDWKIESAR